MTDELVTTVGRQAGKAVVSLHGDVDISTVGQVRSALDDALGPGTREVEVELSGLRFIDSTGLGALVFAFQRCRDAGVAFRLARPTPGVRQILVLSGLLEVVSLAD